MLKYQAEIDGMRALAILPVVFFHAGFELWSGGYVGVDVFFVISGYLITLILIQDIENNEFSLIRFYERRARRIIPALFFMILCCFPLAIWTMPPSMLEEFSQSVIFVGLFASNLFFWRNSGYFDTEADEKPLLHTWSLAVEEQYYLIFPILLVIFSRQKRNSFLFTLCFLAIISFTLSVFASKNFPSANFYLIISRAWELLAGSLVAVLSFKTRFNPRPLLCYIGILGIIIPVFLYDDKTSFPGFAALLPVLGTVLVILFRSEDFLLIRFLSSKPMVFCGMMSYSIYIWHQPIFAFSRIYFPDYHSEHMRFFLIALTFGFGYLSWRFIERPFRATPQKISAKNILQFTLFGSTALFLFGGIGSYTNGLKGITLNGEQKEFLSTANFSPLRNECHTGGRYHKSYQDSCEYFGDEIDTAVFGDSHAVELSYALADQLKRQNKGVKHLSFSGCIPIHTETVPGFENCSAWSEKTVKNLLKDDRINNIIITYRIAYALYGADEQSFPELPDKRGKVAREKIWKELIRLLDYLVKEDKNVVFVLQAPELPKHVELLAWEKQTKTGVSSIWWKKRMEYVYDNLHQIPDGVKVVDPAKLFCRKTHCSISINGKSLYFDDDHMSIYGARQIASKIQELLS